MIAQEDFRQAAENNGLATGRVRPTGGLAACAPRKFAFRHSFVIRHSCFVIYRICLLEGSD
jgi:hypothetical protein